MPDKLNTTEMPDNFSLTVERGAAGLWYVKGSLHPGLFVAHQDLSVALAEVPECFQALKAAERDRDGR